LAAGPGGTGRNTGIGPHSLISSRVLAVGIRARHTEGRAIRPTLHSQHLSCARDERWSPITIDAGVTVDGGVTVEYGISVVARVSGVAGIVVNAVVTVGHRVFIALVDSDIWIRDVSSDLLHSAVLLLVASVGRARVGGSAHFAFPASTA
jgi:hypothetical protein